mgnify:CR=1 FL=1
MIRRKVPIKWSANVRTGSIARLDQDELNLLREGGCDLLHPGVEATTQEMLNYIHKDEKNENTLIAAEKVKKAGIVGLFAFMVSFPDEPENMVQQTFSMISDLKKMNPDNIMPVNFYVPYPGNILYERSQTKGFKPPTDLIGWNDFGTRIGLATPWLTKKVRDEVMKLDKYLLPAAYPSRLLQYRMKNSSFGFVRKGPPEPVRIIRFICCLLSPVRHCQIALCSLSIGKRSQECLNSNSFIISPAMTIDSLFDSATSTPFLIAINVGNIPE